MQFGNVTSFLYWMHSLKFSTKINKKQKSIHVFYIAKWPFVSQIWIFTNIPAFENLNLNSWFKEQTIYKLVRKPSLTIFQDKYEAVGLIIKAYIAKSIK